MVREAEHLIRHTWAAGLLCAAVIFPGGTSMAEGWSDKPWEVKCMDPDPCAPLDANYARQLQGISSWLDELGFAEPAVTHRATDAGVLNWIARVEFGAGTHYETVPWQRLKLGNPYADTQPDLDGEPEQAIDAWFSKNASITVRELFRAVEKNYQPAGFDQKAWIADGMATAVQVAWLERLGHQDEVAKRRYTSPLDLPDLDEQAHGTYSFWEYIGWRISSPSRIAYFKDILQRDLGSQTGIGAVDEALGPHGGLATLLTGFFMWYAENRPEAFEPFNYSAYLQTDEDEREFRFRHRVREVAGQGARVTVTASSQKKTRVEVRIEEDDPDLHMLMAGRRLDHGIGEARNRFRADLEAGESKTYDLIVANVAQTASASEEKTPTLVVKLTTDEEADCCSCEIIDVTTFSGSDILPCNFDHPAGWTGRAGSDGGLAEVVVAPSCGSTCPMGSSGISVSVATKPDSNADTMEEVWQLSHGTVGSARCGDSTVTFYSPPGADPQSTLGGVKFYIGHGGKKYSGAATFTCGEPGAWLELQGLFMDTFRTNPGTSFPGR